MRKGRTDGVGLRKISTQGVSWQRYKLPILVWIGIVVVTLVLWQGLLAQEQAQVRQLLQAKSITIRHEVTVQINTRILALARLAKRWEVRGGTSKLEWEADAEMLLRDFGGYQAIEWADHTFHVRWVVPLAGNEAAQNLNLAFEPQRRAALEAARDQQVISMTPAINLVQGGKGFLIYVPIFTDRVFDGFIVGIFRIEPLLNSILDKSSLNGYAIALFDNQEQIYGYNATIQNHQAAWQQVTTINLHGVRWNLHIWPTPFLLKQVHSPLPGGVLISGLLSACIVSATIYFAQIAWFRSQQIVHINQELENEVRERKQTEWELQRAKEAAEAANQAKSIFLANMSHELRTPLNVILGFTQVMSRDLSLSSEQRENLQIIHKSGNLLLSLINDVLDLSKIEAGRLSLNESSFDLVSLLRSLWEMLHQKAQAKGLNFSLEIAPDVPQYVITDINKLRQVLLNLLSNAIKFTQKGYVTLRVQPVHRSSEWHHSNFSGKPATEFRVHRNQKSTKLLFEVADTGIGIAPSELNAIFDAFIQSQAGKVSNEGTGLGLTISRKFVQLIGGDITVRSTLGEGSTFSFEIPVRLSYVSDVQPIQAHRQIIGLFPGQSRYRFLVVDDQAENRLLLVKLLTKLGVEVQEATNGKEAIRLWQQWQPHLIWMDIRMPVMDGYEATQEIRSSLEGQSPIIIALTAQASKSDRELALKAGCNDYISKPFQEETLFATMAEYLGLSYIYAESEPQQAAYAYSEPPAQIDSLTPDSLCVMPIRWITEMHQAVQLCDGEEIFHLIEQIPGEHTSLIANLTRLAHDFQFQEIEQLIQSLPPEKQT